MQRKLIMVAATILLSGLVGGVNIQGQTVLARFELGGHFSSLSLEDPTLLSTFRIVSVYKGIGGTFTFNLTKHLALDTEANFFPEINFSTDRVKGGWAFQGLAGVKIGKRFNKVGFFGKARPGVLSFSRTIDGGSVTAPFGDFVDTGTPLSIVRRTHFNLDLGGVVEFYPSSKFAIRADVGDTIVHFSEQNVPRLPIPVVKSATRHSLQ